MGNSFKILQFQAFQNLVSFNLVKVKPIPCIFAITPKMFTKHIFQLKIKEIKNKIDCKFINNTT